MRWTENVLKVMAVLRHHARCVKLQLIAMQDSHCESGEEAHSTAVQQ